MQGYPEGVRSVTATPPAQGNLEISLISRKYHFYAKFIGLSQSPGTRSRRYPAPGPQIQVETPIAWLQPS